MANMNDERELPVRWFGPPADDHKVLEFKGIVMPYGERGEITRASYPAEDFKFEPLRTTDYDWAENESNLANPAADLEPATELDATILEFKPATPKSAERILQESHLWNPMTLKCGRCGLHADSFFAEPTACP